MSSESEGFALGLLFGIVVLRAWYAMARERRWRRIAKNVQEENTRLHEEVDRLQDDAAEYRGAISALSDETIELGRELETLRATQEQFRTEIRKAIQEEKP